MARFPENDIISLVGAPPRYDLGESTRAGSSARRSVVSTVSRASASLPLGYGTAEGDPRLRAGDRRAPWRRSRRRRRHGRRHARAVPARLHPVRAGDEAVTTAPLFPLARNVLDAVGADVARADAVLRSGLSARSRRAPRTLSPHNQARQPRLAAKPLRSRDSPRRRSARRPRADGGDSAPTPICWSTRPIATRLLATIRVAAERARARHEGDFRRLAVEMPRRAGLAARLGDHPRSGAAQAIGARASSTR